MTRKTVTVDHHDFQCQDPNCAVHAPMRQVAEDIAERIIRKEWTVMDSFIDHPDIRNHQVPVSYTIGLMAQNLPELLVYGLEGNTANGLLNAAADLLVAKKLTTDLPVRDLILNQPVMFKETDQELIRGKFGWIRRFAPDGKSARIWQMVWSDRQGVFPWERNFDQSLHRFFVPHFRAPGK